MSIVCLFFKSQVSNQKIYFPLLFNLGIFLALSLLCHTEAFALGDSDIKDQVQAVDSSLKTLAHPAMWAVVIYTGVSSLLKQNLVGVGVAAAGAVALTQLSSWIQTQFTALI